MVRIALTLTEADNGKTVRVRVGDSLMLHLYENAATGYRWMFDAPDDKLVTVQDDGYVRQPAGVGGGGTMQWTLRARAAGRTPIKLKLMRSWEGKASARQTFTATLSISPSKPTAR